MNSDPALLDVLTCRGVLLSLHIRSWRGRKKLRAEDLGLDPDTIEERLFSLGHRRLVSREQFARLTLIESRARSLAEENTFPFLNGVARYLPNPCIDRVTARLHSLEQEFREEVERFLVRYPEIRSEAVADWYRAGERLGVDASRLAAVTRNAFPPPDRMERFFGFSVRLFQVAFPDVPQEELVEEGTRRELIRAREEACREARGEIERSCRDFIADCTASLREQTSILCGQMLATIHSSGSVHQKTLNRLIRFIDRFGELNFMNDSEMAGELEAVRQEFLSRTADEYRGEESARRSLAEGLEALREKAEELASANPDGILTRFGQLGRRRFDFAA